VAGLLAGESVLVGDVGQLRAGVVALARERGFGGAERLELGLEAGRARLGV
jgi:hypothetical protein